MLPKNRETSIWQSIDFPNTVSLCRPFMKLIIQFQTYNNIFLSLNQFGLAHLGIDTLNLFLSPTDLTVVSTQSSGNLAPICGFKINFSKNSRYSSRFLHPNPA